MNFCLHLQFTGPQLFDSSEEEDSAEEEDNGFHIRPQFEGQAGQKVKSNCSFSLLVLFPLGGLMAFLFKAFYILWDAACEHLCQENVTEYIQSCFCLWRAVSVWRECLNRLLLNEYTLNCPPGKCSDQEASAVPYSSTNPG